MNFAFKTFEHFWSHLSYFVPYSATKYKQSHQWLQCWEMKTMLSIEYKQLHLTAKTSTKSYVARTVTCRTALAKQSRSKTQKKSFEKCELCHTEMQVLILKRNGNFWNYKKIEKWDIFVDFQTLCGRGKDLFSDSQDALQTKKGKHKCCVSCRHFFFVSRSYFL